MKNTNRQTMDQWKIRTYKHWTISIRVHLC